MRRLNVPVLITALTIALVNPAIMQAKNTEAVFAYLDVGQGNSELIKVKGNVTLIDTGKKWAYSKLQKQLSVNGVKKITTLVVSHPDADHMESADKVISDYHVKKVIMPKIKVKTKCYRSLVSSIKKYKVRLVNPGIGSKISLGNKCNGKILSVDANPRDTNESSIVMRVTYGKRSFLYMWDATAKVENSIIKQKYPIASDVYLCSHHGANTANGALFVKKVLASKYKITIISVGNNGYGHPVKEVIKRLAKYSKHLYRTDRDGMVMLKTDGNKLMRVKS